MKTFLKKIVKYTPFIYTIYYYVFGFMVRFLKLFIRVNPRKILFMSFGGKSFSDSPQKMYDYLKKHNDERLELVWAFENPERIKEISDHEKVKVDTVKFYLTALSAKAWVTNSSIERGLKFKNKKTFYFDTWHGTPIKKMGSDILENKSFSSKGGFEQVDGFVVQSNYEANVFSRVFNIEQKKMLKFGLPRNDELVNEQTNREKTRKKFNLLSTDKVILYAPTFREFNHNSIHQITSDAEILMKSLAKKLPTNYKILVRAHYEVDIIKGSLKNSDRLINVSSYANINDLIDASDMLISDYSSVIFDYALTQKPIFVFSYDFDEYSEKRGLYFDIEKQLLAARNVNDLSQLILKNENVSKKYVKKFKDKYLNFYGQATKQSCEYIKNKLN